MKQRSGAGDPAHALHRTAVEIPDPDRHGEAAASPPTAQLSVKCRLVPVLAAAGKGNSSGVTGPKPGNSRHRIGENIESPAPPRRHSSPGGTPPRSVARRAQSHRPPHPAVRDARDTRWRARASVTSPLPECQARARSARHRGRSDVNPARVQRRHQLGGAEPAGQLHRGQVEGAARAPPGRGPARESGGRNCAARRDRYWSDRPWRCRAGTWRECSRDRRRDRTETA